MHQLFPGFSKMDAKYMMICLLPMLSGNNYVFADKNGEGICEFKATYVRLFINHLYVSFQVMFWRQMQTEAFVDRYRQNE